MEGIHNHNLEDMSSEFNKFLVPFPIISAWNEKSLQWKWNIENKFSIKHIEHVFGWFLVGNQQSKTKYVLKESDREERERER